MCDGYVFLHERIQRVVAERASTVDDRDLDVEIREALTLGDDPHNLLVYTLEDLVAASSRLVHRLERDAAERASRRSGVMSTLLRHKECVDVLDELLVERDSLIAAVRRCQAYCCNDVTVGEYGELFVHTRRLLDALRPRIASHHRWPPTYFEGMCSSCGRLVHHDECPDFGDGEELEERSEHKIRSHRHCAEIADELLLQIERQYAHIDSIAACAVRWSRHEYREGQVVDPRKVLEILAAEQPCADVPRTTVTAAVSAPVGPVDYCQDPDYHAYPHAACRWLVS
ncbi:hypothetical protein [Cellulomonas palmilytica]|uniref:hypothetical protein n=1 Tax=Cellulomonas palmilytica TaxID=2608402 RepID=UPI001F32FE2A|nr:hypothetical protein [Cellulomonas palmilytica]UJP40361.1 hypothetical protein F1D97_02165 [Cellulomonas palmilytica]